MTTLEKIKAAAKMGYSTILKGRKEYQVLAISKNGCLINEIGKMKVTGCGKDMDSFEITGYLYVGMLFGASEIPGGHRFKVKATGEIKITPKVLYNRQTRIWLESIDSDVTIGVEYDRAEVEPIFD